MASGDHSATVAIASEDLPMGSVITSSGRISGVHRVGEPFTDDLPFETMDLVALDVALTEATRATKVRFNAYIGDLGANPAAGADALFPTTLEAERSVLIAVSPNQRVVEVRSGRVIADRVTDRVAQLGATAAVSSFSEGNLIDGLISAIRVMSAAISAP
ncbi:DUF5130 domain-containing protein [Rhodococcus sp. IEGM 1379]|uniref:DUF5130 domain-containing protein n=1 Tax=Rhodococcus sp. IEGM 1379 TaxID=3047086 RepID=UPI0024B7E06B|nr:DUF5130 domain-containing protein [Rhodococcus sp. IEGM 1379]MDI9917614.1 DUF5130 domain-containing protein [Rhodococcus sp. IEGM 1379]